MELELNSLDWNVNELEYELELEDMKRTYMWPIVCGSALISVKILSQ